MCQLYLNKAVGEKMTEGKEGRRERKKERWKVGEGRKHYHI